MIIKCFEVAGLLYGTTGFGAHEEPVPAVYAVWSVEGGEPFAFFTYGDSPEGREAINLQVIFATVELFDFVSCKRNGACAGLKAFVEQGIDRDPEAVLRGVLALARGSLGTMTRREIHLGFLQGDTTGVL